LNQKINLIRGFDKKIFKVRKLVAGAGFEPTTFVNYKREPDKTDEKLKIIFEPKD
jgi:hypothetical protein